MKVTQLMSSSPWKKFRFLSREGKKLSSLGFGWISGHCAIPAILIPDSAVTYLFQLPAYNTGQPCSIHCQPFYLLKAKPPIIPTETIKLWLHYFSWHLIPSKACLLLPNSTCLTTIWYNKHLIKTDLYLKVPSDGSCIFKVSSDASVGVSITWFWRIARILVGKQL